jgi:glycosyltransferase involved in cell wall biosynthesis
MVSLELKRVLYISEHPPSDAGGAPLIMHKLLRNYDMQRLDVLCDARQYGLQQSVRRSCLPCRHTTIRNAEGRTELRPRRIFNALGDSVNVLRIGSIVRAGKRIVTERGVELLFTVPWRCEFALAAYRLSRATGLPLYVFETDDWEAMNPHSIPGVLVRRHHADLLRHASNLWLISPAMVERYREKFGVEGRFLHHYVDADAYARAARDRERLSDVGTVRIVYTGAINSMFFDTMRELCALINHGIQTDGRSVTLDIYGGGCPQEFLGQHVHYRGFVASHEIPAILAGADVALIGVTFSTEPSIIELVRTSIYTKTIDYLAADRPVLIVAPRYAAEVDYFRDVATIVDTLDRQRITDAIAALAREDHAVREQRRRGLEFVRTHHSASTMADAFLRHFRS